MKITYQQAIKILEEQKNKSMDGWVDFDGVIEAYNMAIDALSKKQEQEEEQEYIISYAKDYYRVDQAYWVPERKADYLYAVSRHHLKEGDIAPWNNQYWWSVKARNAKNAFEKFWWKFTSKTPMEKENNYGFRSIRAD